MIKKLPLIIITIIALLTWYKLFSRVPTGEGYFYFAPETNIDFKILTIKTILKSYGLLPSLIFTIIIPVFKDHISYYMYFQFAIMLVTYYTFYFFVLKIFKDGILALTSTIFFIANYVGQFTMMGQGDYQRFIQRVPNIIPTFISLFFIFKYLESKKNKHLFISYLIYILIMILDHYTIFFVPIFALIPLSYSIFTKKIGLIKASIISTLYLMSAFVLTHTDVLSRPSYSVITFIKTTPHLFEMIIYQISMSAFPVQLTSFIAKHHNPEITPPYTQIQLSLFVLISTIFVIGFIKIKKHKEISYIYVSLIASLFAISFLNMYAYDTMPNPLLYFGEDRIYFIHSILFALIYGIFIKVSFEKKNKSFYKRISVVILFFYLLLNISSIWTAMDSTQNHSEIAKNYISQIRYISPKIDKETYIVGPYELFTTAVFNERFYNLLHTNFINLDTGWEKQLNEHTNNKNNIYVFDIEYKSGKVINLTKEFLENKKIEPNKQ